MGEFAPLAFIVVGIVTVLGLATAYFTAQNLGFPGSVGVLAVLLVILTIAALIVWGKMSARAAKNRAVQDDARDWANWVVTFPDEVQETVKILSSPWEAAKKWSAVDLGRLPDPMKGDPGQWPELVPSRNAANPALADRGVWSVPVGLRMRLRMTDGQARKHYEAQLGRLAVALNADAVRIVAFQKKIICLDVQYFDPILDPIPVPVPFEPVNLLKVRTGLRVDGTPWTVPLLERNLLGVGEPGSGKSGFVRALVTATAPMARDGSLVNLMIDLKFGVEAAKLRGLLHGTATSAETALNLLRWVRWVAVEQRGRFMEAHGLDKHVPTPDEPFFHLIIDEIAELLDDPETRAEFLRLLISIGRLGRALMFSMSAYTQLSNKKILDMLRDLFQVRVGWRLNSPEQVTMLYGDHHAQERGADNTSIPIDGAQGVAFVADDTSSQIVRVRTYYVTAENLVWFAQQYPPARHPDLESQLAEILTVGAGGTAGTDAPAAAAGSAVQAEAPVGVHKPRYEGDELPALPEMSQMPSMFAAMDAEIEAEVEARSAAIGKVIDELDPSEWPVDRSNRARKSAVDDREEAGGTVYPFADRRKQRVEDAPPQTPAGDEDQNPDGDWDDWDGDAAADSGDESA